MIASTMLFIFVKNAYKYRVKIISANWLNRYDKFINNISQYSFGIFLVHMLVLQSIIRLFKLDATSLITAIVLAPITIVISWLLTAVMKKIPKINLLVR